jgi:hypothetical protein
MSENESRSSTAASLPVAPHRTGGAGYPPASGRTADD